jgi:hypothetical protein
MPGERARRRRRRLFLPVWRLGAKAFLGMEIGGEDLFKSCQPVPFCAMLGERARRRRRRLFLPVWRLGAKAFLGVEIGGEDLFKSCQPVPFCAMLGERARRRRRRLDQPVWRWGPQSFLGLEIGSEDLRSPPMSPIITDVLRAAPKGYLVLNQVFFTIIFVKKANNACVTDRRAHVQSLE